MKAVKVLLGLLVDDVRLVAIVLLTLALAFVLKLVHHTQASPYVMVVGLLLALLFSVEHQLRLKVRK